MKKHEEDLKLVEKQRKELEAKGYYTMKNGEKSTALEAKKRKSKVEKPPKN